MRRIVTAPLVAAALLLAGLTPAGAAVTESESPERPKARRFHLACQLAAPRDADQGPSVTCKWSHLSDTSSYRLARAMDHEPREFVYRGEEASFVDTDVSAGHTYAYRVQALRRQTKNELRRAVPARGRWSNVAVVKIRPLPDRRLRLACEAAEGPAVDCRWSASGHPDRGPGGVPLDTVSYRLVRAERQQRQIAYSGPQTSHLDRDVAPGHRYLYLVQSLDADGTVTGSSHRVKVGVPPKQSRPAHPPVREPGSIDPDPDPDPQPRPEPGGPQAEPVEPPSPDPTPRPHPKAEEPKDRARERKTSADELKASRPEAETRVEKTRQR